MALVIDFTKNRETSCKNLTDLEAFELIKFLQNKVKTAEYSQQKEAINTQKYTYQDGDRMRKKVISIAYQLHWATAGDWRTAIDAIDKFLIEKGVHKKTLKAHTPAELVKVVTQFEQMLVKDLRK